MPDPKSDANNIIEDKLDSLIEELSEVLKADVLVYHGPIIDGIEILIRDALEGIKRRKKTLAFILETPGGYVEVAQRIADTIRKHYRHVEFIIPNYAMSAGTVLAMAGDTIYMDYFSVLGPIDPQVEVDGRMVPALGYLEKYKDFIEKDKNNDLTAAELAYFVKRFDPATLYQYEQQKELSVTLLKEWLVKYKFKNWKITQTHRAKVTIAMKKQRAEEIAKKLNNTALWHSHSRGISMPVLRRALNLKIEDFGENPSLNKCLRGYTRLLGDYMAKLRHTAVIHVKGTYRPLMAQQ